MLDTDKIRNDFPILSRDIADGKPLIYLDTTATSQTPVKVLDEIDSYYRKHNANVHRGIHTLAEEATTLYENARSKVAKFIGAGSSREVVFTRNTTEALNLVARSWGNANLQSGDRILLTEMEHHSNLVPWQMLSNAKGLEIDIIPITDDGELNLTEFEKLLAKGPKVVCITHMSNVLGTVNPIKRMCSQARDAGAIMVVDGAQSAPHMTVNMQELDIDFFAFSGHKMCGPTGVGVLWGRSDLLEEMPPFLGGGDMIKRVFLRSFEPNDIPYKFEAGTPNICEAIALGSAVDYLSSVGMDDIWTHERYLIEYAVERLEEVPGIKVYGPATGNRGGVASFSLDGVHPHDVAQVLDRDGIAVRAGHHCAMPLHNRLDVVATTRASFYLYNTRSEIDRLIDGIYKVKVLLG